MEYEANDGGERLMRVGYEPEPKLTHYCPDYQAEIDEANAAYQPKPARINWKQFFEEDSSSTLNTFYSGVEA